jgi:hypothetical protein
LKLKGKKLYRTNQFIFPPEFIKKHRLGTPSRPNTKHSYDIYTTDDILIEIDDVDKHSKKSQKINDGIRTDYAETYLVPKGYKFIVLMKEWIVDSKGFLLPAVADYLQDNLF